MGEELDGVLDIILSHGHGRRSGVGGGILLGLGLGICSCNHSCQSNHPIQISKFQIPIKSRIRYVRGNQEYRPCSCCDGGVVVGFGSPVAIESKRSERTCAPTKESLASSTPQVPNPSRAVVDVPNTDTAQPRTSLSYVLLHYIRSEPNLLLSLLPCKNAKIFLPSKKILLSFSHWITENWLYLA